MANTPTTKRSRDESDTTQKDQSPAKRMVNINDFDNTITVLVGPKEQRFMLHQDAVCAKSRFFRAACSKRWLEGQEKIVRLPEVNAATFKVYCSWVYSDDIPGLVCTDSSDTNDKNAEKEVLIDLYLIGDKLDDLLLRNRAMDMIFTSMRNQNTLLCLEFLRRVYDSTLRGSFLRKMYVDTVVRRLTRNSFGDNLPFYPHEFVEEVAVASMQASSYSTWEQTAESILQYKETEQSE